MMTILTTLLIVWGTISIIYGMHYFVHEKKGYYRSTMLLLGLSAGMWQLGYGIFGICDNLHICAIIRAIALFGVTLYPLTETVLALYMTGISKKIQYAVRTVLTVFGLTDWILFSNPNVDIFERVGGFTRFRAVSSTGRNIHVIFVMTVFLIAFISWLLWFKRVTFKREKRLLYKILVANFTIMVCTIPDTMFVSKMQYGYPTSGIGAGISLLLWFVASEKYNTFLISSGTLGDYVEKVVNEGVIVFDVSGEAIEVNAFAKDKLGIKSGQKPSELLAIGKSDEEIFKELEESGSVIYKSNIINEDMVYIANMTVARDDYGEPFGYIMTLTDITNEERLIVEAKSASSAKSRFLANMSHEIRTPMNAITGFADIILRDSKDEVARENASFIASSAKTLLAIINDVLDFSKIESGKLSIVNENYNTVSLLSDVSAIIRIRLIGKRVSLDVNISPDFPSELIGDEIRIKQVLINLLNNAVKYTQEGYIILSLDYEKIDEKKCRIMASVTDTGIGIKEEDLCKLFESFTQVDTRKNKNEEGTGLGLAIAKRLVNMMGGDLRVESVYGQGSKFTFDFINEVSSWEGVGEFEEALHYREPELFRTSMTAEDAKILVVDDNSVNLRVMEGLLMPYGIKPTCVESGIASIRCAERMKFDIIFMDHMMADMDGYEAMNRIHSIEGCENVPVIVFTANALSGARQEYIKMGFDDFIAKPVSPVDIDNVLRKFLREELINEN
jgi:signal transduction histidine kinase/ActR/RegA family two-component response regulator